MTDSPDAGTAAPAGAPAVRPAEPDDVPEMHALVHELAVFENEPHAVAATEDDLRRVLFGANASVFAHVAPAPEGSGRRIDGMALWFLTYSTWEGRLGIHLEDLVVRADARGHGHGGALLRTLAQIAVERDYRRVEWSVLTWNEPAIGFYRGIGAIPLDDWRSYRLDGEALLRYGSADDRR